MGLGELVIFHLLFDLLTDVRIFDHSTVMFDHSTTRLM